MRVLIVGDSAIEVFVARRLKEDKRVERLFCFTENVALAMECDETLSFSSELASLIESVREKEIDFVISWSLKYMKEGLVDSLRAIGVKCFGLTAEGAKQTSDFVSKIELAKENNITVPDYQRVEGEYLQRAALISLKNAMNILISPVSNCDDKLSVLIGNKLSTFAEYFSNYKKAVDGFKGKIFSIQENVEKETLSLNVVFDGEDVLLMKTQCSQNAEIKESFGFYRESFYTYSPNPGADEDYLNDCLERVIFPILYHYRSKGIELKGIFTFNLQKTMGKPVLINWHFADESTVVLCALNSISTDLLSLFIAITEGKVAECDVSYYPVGVVCLPLYVGDFKVIDDMDNLVVKKSEVSDNRIYLDNVRFARNGDFISKGRFVAYVLCRAVSLIDADKTAQIMAKKISFLHCKRRRDALPKNPIDTSLF